MVSVLNLSLLAEVEALSPMGSGALPACIDTQCHQDAESDVAPTCFGSENSAVSSDSDEAVVIEEAPKVQARASRLKVPSLLQRRQFGSKLSLSPSKIRMDVRPVAPVEQGSLEQYTVLEELGQGSCGIVYRALRKADKTPVALKLMRIADPEEFAAAEREYKLLRGIDHSCVVKAIDFFRYSKGAVLVMEHFDGTDLQALIGKTSHRKLGEATVASLFGQLVGALRHLHKLGVVHRDVKAENVLVSSDLRHLKLVDFNTAERVCEGGTLLDRVGTPAYMSPEVLLGEAVTEAADIWGAGLCLHLMLFGNLPADRNDFASHEDFGRALRAGGGFTPSTKSCGGSFAARAVLAKCLELDFQKRATACSVLEHTWFSASL